MDVGLAEWLATQVRRVVESSRCACCFQLRCVVSLAAALASDTCRSAVAPRWRSGTRTLRVDALAPVAYVVGGGLCGNCPPTARDVLRALPRGAYTVARTLQRTRLVDWR